jgi:methyl-accepting chemotaxis protein
MEEQAKIAFREEESRLQDKLNRLEKRMRNLRRDDGNGTQLFSDSQTEEIQQFRQAFVETRQQLRNVQRRLNEDINALKLRLSLLNIGLVPLFVLALAFILPGWLRRQRP